MVAAGEWTLAATAAVLINTASAAIELSSQITLDLILPNSDKGGELSPTKAFWKLRVGSILLHVPSFFLLEEQTQA